MNVRLAYAYGMFHALAGSIVFAVAGTALVQMTVGNYVRQPLPLVWPLAVLHVAVAQIPLREILGPVERVSARGPVTRAVRALVALLLLATGPVTYLAVHGNPSLSKLFLVLAALGFVAAGTSRSDPWVWTLGAGLIAVGVQFLTPWGPVSRLLEPVPAWSVALVVGLSAGVFVLRGQPRRP